MLRACLWTSILGYLNCLEVIPERPNLEYYNKQYISYAKLTIRKHSRNSPHYIDVDTNTTVGFGNNVTVSLKLLEFLSGRYQPTPLQRDYKLCDFLYKEPFIGQMYAKQLTGNWSCPFAPGKYSFHNLVIHLENFPYNIPFTWASVSVKTRVDVEGHVMVKNVDEPLVRFKVYVTVIQKPKKY